MNVTLESKSHIYQKYNIVCTEIDILKGDMLRNVKTKFLFNRINHSNWEKNWEKRRKNYSVFQNISIVH